MCFDFRTSVLYQFVVRGFLVDTINYLYYIYSRREIDINLIKKRKKTESSHEKPIKVYPRRMFRYSNDER